VRSLSASDSTLVIQAPTWIGVLLVGVGIALAIFVLVRKVPRPARLGAFLATVALLYAGWYLLSTSMTFEARGFYVDGMFGEEERVGWLQVSGIDTGAPAGSRNFDPVRLTFYLRNSNEVTIDLSGLTAQEKAHVVAFVKGRLKRQPG
jgi:hypothetical protein